MRLTNGIVFTCDVRDVLASVAEVTLGLCRWMHVSIVGAGVVLDLIMVLSKSLLELVDLCRSIFLLWSDALVLWTVANHGLIILKLHVVTRTAMSYDAPCCLVKGCGSTNRLDHDVFFVGLTTS